MMNPQIDDLLDSGIEHHGAGQLTEAATAYNAVLALDPANPDALHLLGVLAHQNKDYARAANLIEQAILIDPTVAEYHNNLAEAYNAQERFDDALAAFLNASELDPSQINPWQKLGILYQTRRQFEDAARCYHRAVLLDPACPESHNNLGIAYRHLNRHKEAETCFREAIRLKPAILPKENLVRTLMDLQSPDEALALAQEMADENPDRAAGYTNCARILNSLKRHNAAMHAAYIAIQSNPAFPEAHFQLGVAFEAMGEQEGAVLAFARTAELDPQRFAPHMNLGLAFLAVGEIDRAIQAFLAGVDIARDSSVLWHNLAIAYERAKKFDEAIEAGKKLVSISPDNPRALAVLGTLYMRVAKYEEAIATFATAAEFDADFFEIHNNLASVHAERGDIKSALVSARRAVSIEPENPRAYNVYLMHLNCDADATLDEVFDAHKKFGAIQEKRFPTKLLPPSDPDPDRKLRVGYISPDFRAHSVSFFISPVLAGHDRSQFHVIGYDNSSKPDEITKRLQGLCQDWRRVTGLSDEQIVKQIHDDRIDILVDLAGHTGDNRMLVLARRAAPVQITYLGYPNTSGVSNIDYRITDAYADPPGIADRFYTERLVRLPQSFLCYATVANVPPVQPTPALHNGFITFGSFNMLNKMSEPVISLWARILSAVPTAKLFLKANGLTEPQTQALIQNRFAAHGIEAHRLIIKGRQDTFEGHMAMYHDIDIGLDPFPYNGTTTTCEALTMGVPIVTLAGRSHVGRVGLSILTNLGLPELIADTPDDYLRTATELAGDLDRLTALRTTMRSRLRASPLMQVRPFVAALENAYRQLWRTACNLSSIPLE